MASCLLCPGVVKLTRMLPLFSLVALSGFGPCSEAPVVGLDDNPNEQEEVVEQEECPPVCEVDCEYGNVLDDLGCATCACNPAPACEDLDELACLADTRCSAVYDAGGRLAPCACDPCGPNDSDCNCNCEEPHPEEPVYSHCIENPTLDPCGQLDEVSCIDDARCAPVYEAVDCFKAPPCEEPGCGGDVPECPTDPIFVGCQESEPPPSSCEGLPEETCIANQECEPYYGTGDGDADCYRAPCDPTNPNCGAPEPCDPPQGYLGCGPRAPGCSTDADCPNGYCEVWATCASLDCPAPPPPSCVFPLCNDGSQVLCDALPPVCGVGETAGLRDGCWVCVDARTCQ